jgi:hypothetical protein
MSSVSSISHGFLQVLSSGFVILGQWVAISDRRCLVFSSGDVTLGCDQAGSFTVNQYPFVSKNSIILTVSQYRNIITYHIMLVSNSDRHVGAKSIEN